MNRHKTAQFMNGAFAAVALVSLIIALMSLARYNSLIDIMNENFHSDAVMVETWNEGSEFIARKIVILEANQEEIAAHVGLDFVDGEMSPFDMECLVVSDDMDPPLLKCNKTFGDGG